MNIDLNCPRCEQTFQRERWYVNRQKRRGHELYCSKGCASSANNLVRYAKRDLICANCGKQETVNESHYRSKYCSQACYQEHQKEEIRLRPEKFMNAHRDKAIAHRMQNIAAGKTQHSRTGKTHTEQSKQQISDARKKYFRRNKHPFTGKQHSLATREAMSAARAALLLRGGFKPFWLQNESGWLTLKRRPKPVWYRSSWEKRHLLALDSDPSVAEFYPESLRIPYHYEYKRNYIPDVLVFYRDGRIELHEIKPEAFLSYPINIAKFEAAQAYCAPEGIHFRVLSDEHFAA